VVVGTSLVKEGKADALVTMGSTGAAMAASSILLGLLEGIERPALGGTIIGLAPNTVLLEVGANVDCRPSQLVDFAALGVAFAKVYLKATEPRVALLSMGEEEGKGNRQTREATEAFQGSGLNFIGNVEGHDLVTGGAEVVVCDGFVGNVVMKTVEAIGEGLAAYLRERLRDLLPEGELEALAREVYSMLNLAKTMGGGPLFGVKGLVVVGHGSTRAAAVANAIKTAKYASDVDLLLHMERELRQLRARSAS
jgi:glycerol-3-phosphate acyltransferase PlsX